MRLHSSRLNTGSWTTRKRLNRRAPVHGVNLAICGLTFLRWRTSDFSLKQTVGWCCTNGRFWPKTVKKLTNDNIALSIVSAIGTDDRFVTLRALMIKIRPVESASESRPRYIL